MKKTVVNPKISEIPAEGIHMSTEDYMNKVFDGVYTDSKGKGFQATITRITDVPINPSDVYSRNFERSFSSVVWIPNKI